MSKKVPTALPCEACGGLLPLKPIHSRRRQRRSESSRGQDAPHSRLEQGSTNEFESSGGGLPLSDDSETEESSGKLRSYDSVLEEIQAIFANQKVKRETISPNLHRAHKHRDRGSNRSRRHERSQAHQHAISQCEHQRPSKSRSPVNSPCFLHPHQGRHNIHAPTCKSSVAAGEKDDASCCIRSMAGQNDEPTSVSCQSDEPTCRRIVGQLPQDDASNCSFDPLRISPSPRIHAAQSSTHHLGENSARGTAKAGGSSSPGKSRHGAVVHHQDSACRPASEPAAERNTQPRMNNDCYHDVLRLYEECHIHQIDQHIPATLITSPRGRSRRSQRHGCREASPQSQQQQQQIMYSCHQHTVILHHEGCHLHPRDDPQSPAAPSPRTRKCQRCGCSEQNYNAPIEAASLQNSAERTDRKVFVNSASSPEQEVIACAQRHTPRCKMHGDCSEVDVCGICCHPKKDHKDLQRMDYDLSPRKENIEGCHLHSFPSPKCQEPEAAANPKCKDAASPKFKDALVWAPRRVRKPKPCSSAHWLDRVVASQKIPSHVIQQFLQGKRNCAPRVKKPKCPACIAKCLKAQPHRTHLTFNRDPCEREVSHIWNSGSDIASGIECKEQKRGKLTRLALSRTLIVKPVVKLSTSQGPWTSRKEFQVCSECRNPLVTKSGHWKSILEELSDIPKKCSYTRLSCQTIHGSVLPSDTGTQTIDLRCPELYSAFRLHSRLQDVQNETFDREAAMQVAQSQGIELDKELFDQLLPEIKKPKKGSPRRSSGGCPRNYVCRKQRREVYRDLCNIVDPPMPVCPVPEYPFRDVAVQVGNTVRALEDSNKWNPSDFGAQSCLHSNQVEQSSLQPFTPYPTYRPEQEQITCQAPEKSWDEQHWVCQVEACKQARMEQGVYGSCAACPLHIPRAVLYVAADRDAVEKLEPRLLWEMSMLKRQQHPEIPR